MSKLGYSNQVIKEKQDKGQYLSKEEEAYLDMEAAQAAAQIIGVNKRKGSDFVLRVLRKAAELADEVRNEELRKQGKQPPSREPQSLERAPDPEVNNDPLNIFGSIYGQGK